MYDGRAGTNKGYIGIFDLPFTGTASDLHRPFNDLPEAMDTAGAQTTAKRVEGQLAIQLDASVLNEIQRFALLGSARGIR